MVPLRIGISLTAQQTLGTDQAAALEEQLGLLRLAREHGWDSVGVAQHDLSEGLTHLHPVPLLTRYAVEAGGEMNVGVGICLLALQNPVDVAEAYATIDVISGGRLTFGAGLGYRKIEYNAFGVPPDQRQRRFRENLGIVDALWRGEG